MDANTPAIIYSRARAEIEQDAVPDLTGSSIFSRLVLQSQNPNRGASEESGL